METKDELLLDENQHRLVVCCRMAKALGKGEIFLDATTHKMHWRMEKDDKVTGIFHSLDEMEDYLEHLLENRSKLCSVPHYTDSQVRRRLDVIHERNRARTNGTPMVFHSRINN